MAQQRKTPPYLLHSPDGRATIVVHSGPPATAHVIHDNLTEAEIDIALMALSRRIPAPCCVIAWPRWWSASVLCELGKEPIVHSLLSKSDVAAS
jgi:hypothetical protein